MLYTTARCPEEPERNGLVVWPITGAGQTVMQPCFPNVSSINFTATRTCVNNDNIGWWLPANISECSQGKSAFLTTSEFVHV